MIQQYDTLSLTAALTSLLTSASFMQQPETPLQFSSNFIARNPLTIQNLSPVNLDKMTFIKNCHFCSSVHSQSAESSSVQAISLHSTISTSSISSLRSDKTPTLPSLTDTVGNSDSSLHSSSLKTENNRLKHYHLLSD